MNDAMVTHASVVMLGVVTAYGRAHHKSRRWAARAAACAMLVVSATAWPAEAHAQWATTYEKTYLQAPHNWAFRNQYQSADRLFNAFDYGHAILYETLWRRPDAPASVLEQKIYDRLTTQILVRPPKVPLEELAIEPMYARIAPEAKAMFDWAHLLHRQIYDVLADERLPATAKDAEIARLIAYYKTRPELAFSSMPKSMALMQEQPYSLAFRKKFPKFNGLIWAYHWLQVGLYEPLLVGRTPAERQAGVRATTSRFWQMVEAPIRSYPHVMPMTAVVAPQFAARYPEAAIIFDNLHSMHDVISDILANPAVPRSRKRAEILLAGARYRDNVTDVMTTAGWLAMTKAMGIENMGGPSVGFMAALPTPNVEYGAVMQHAGMTGMHDMPGMDHGAMQHAAGTPDRSTPQAAVAAFHAALAAGDSTAALALLADDAVIVESGETQTRAEYRAQHLAADIAYAKAVPSTRATPTVSIDGATAWVSSTSTTRGAIGGRTIDSGGAELMVLSRETDGTWHIRAIHWSSRAVRK